MRNRLMGLISRVILVLLALAGIGLSQIAVRQKIAEVKPAPRAPDGKPDLSGVWGVVDRAPGIDTRRARNPFISRKCMAVCRTRHRPGQPGRRSDSCTTMIRESRRMELIVTSAHERNSIPWNIAFRTVRRC